MNATSQGNSPMDNMALSERLLKVGNELEHSFQSRKVLLSILKESEDCLHMVDQSHSRVLQVAMNPIASSLGKPKLLRYKDHEVRLVITSCLSEILRIAAPNIPYQDDTMEEIFSLLVESFEGLNDVTNSHFPRRVTILESFAKLRLNNIMLDLALDDLIIKMFHCFFAKIRTYHATNVKSAMHTILSLILDEKDDISKQLLSNLLFVWRKQDVLSAAYELSNRLVEQRIEEIKDQLTENELISLGLQLIHGDSRTEEDHIEASDNTFESDPEITISYEGHTFGVQSYMQREDIVFVTKIIHEEEDSHEELMTLHDDKEDMINHEECDSHEEDLGDAYEVSCFGSAFDEEKWHDVIANHSNEMADFDHGVEWHDIIPNLFEGSSTIPLQNQLVVVIVHKNESGKTLPTFGTLLVITHDEYMDYPRLKISDLIHHGMIETKRIQDMWHMRNKLCMELDSDIEYASEQMCIDVPFLIHDTLIGDGCLITFNIEILHDTWKTAAVRELCRGLDHVYFIGGWPMDVVYSPLNISDDIGIHLDVIFSYWVDDFQQMNHEIHGIENQDMDRKEDDILNDTQSFDSELMNFLIHNGFSEYAYVLIWYYCDDALVIGFDVNIASTSE